jgi:glycosyltransferase involved in cell wall biosynthesis
MKVSVLLITYNHERYIAEAIDSVLMQEVSFDYEIIIGEDCSIDATRDIVTGYSSRFPDKIRLVLSEKNAGECSNIARTLRACRGEYIAMLDGDDYWTSPRKLQKQVDFLENNPEFTIYCHNAISIYEDGSREAYMFNPDCQKEISTIDDLWTGNFIATCTAMLRREPVSHLPAWYCDLKWGDWPL